MPYVFFTLILFCQSLFSHTYASDRINVTGNWQIQVDQKQNKIDVTKDNQKIFSLSPELLHGPVDYVLVGPTEGEQGPFLVTVWGKGASSHVALTFDLSGANAGVDSRSLLVHSYISAHDIQVSQDAQKLTAQLEMIGRSYEFNKRDMDHAQETVVCKWQYKPDTKELDCKGP